MIYTIVLTHVFIHCLIQNLYMSKKSCNFAADYENSLNRMENKTLVKVEVNFNDILNVHFDAEEISTEKTRFYREKNFEKKLEDLAYITLFGPEMRIMLRIGVMYLPFAVKSGNLNKFEGHYEISYAGHDGTADILFE